MPGRKSEASSAMQTTRKTEKREMSLDNVSEKRGTSLDNISYFVSNIALDLMRPLQQCPEVDHGPSNRKKKRRHTRPHITLLQKQAFMLKRFVAWVHYYLSSQKLIEA